MLQMSSICSVFLVNEFSDCNKYVVHEETDTDVYECLKRSEKCNII
jgi:hypothetical protein